MKDISIYFKPVDSDIGNLKNCFGEYISIHTENNFPDINVPGIAIISAPEYRRSNRRASEHDLLFRHKLYSFQKGEIVVTQD